MQKRKRKTSDLIKIKNNKISEVLRAFSVVQMKIQLFNA